MPLAVVRLPAVTGLDTVVRLAAVAWATTLYIGERCFVQRYYFVGSEREFFYLLFHGIGCFGCECRFGDPMS
jgi:hypothetical protein